MSDLGVVKEEKEEKEEEWFTADEGVFDKQLGHWVVSPAMLERIKRREKEVADSEVKSATKLKLQFDLNEVIYVYAILVTPIYMTFDRPGNPLMTLNKYLALLL